MKSINLPSIFLLVLAALSLKAENVALPPFSWSIDKKTEVYTNHPTNVSFPKNVSGFERKRAEPVMKDGGAQFAYFGERGAVTLYFVHRIFRDQGTDDCTKRFYESLSNVVEKGNGKSDLRESFALSYESGGKKIMGFGTVYHFSASKIADGKPVYSELGVVLVGDFLYYYRATFLERAGLDDLSKFLAILGFVREANQSLEATSTTVTPAAGQPSRQP